MTTDTITVEHRQWLVRWLREAGHSGRVIAWLLDVAKSSVFRDLDRLRAAGLLDDEPDRTIGFDGRTQPARKTPTVVCSPVRSCEQALHEYDDAA